MGSHHARKNGQIYISKGKWTQNHPALDKVLLVSARVRTAGGLVRQMVLCQEKMYWNNGSKQIKRGWCCCVPFVSFRLGGGGSTVAKESISVLRGFNKWTSKLQWCLQDVVSASRKLFQSVHDFQTGLTIAVHVSDNHQAISIQAKGSPHNSAKS